MKKKEEKSKRDSVAGSVFVGCLMIGAGFGMLYGNPAVGAL